MAGDAHREAQALGVDTSGTLFYIAPELYRGQPPTVQSDVFALGVILYQIMVADFTRPLTSGWERDIDDPEAKMSVWQRLQLSKIAQAKSADERKELRQRADLRINALGSGTDFTAFLDHLGIATLDLAYEGEDDGGIYHSVYDDFYWYTHFSDYDFIYGRALSQTVGTSVMRLADAEVLPFDFVDFADTVQKYTKDLEKLLADKQEESVAIWKNLPGIYWDTRVTRAKPAAAWPATRS